MFKKLILFMHRWLGLITGLVVFILSLTGALYVFQTEITHWLRKDMMYVEDTLQQRLSLDELYGIAEDELQIESLNYGLTTYKDTGQSWSAFHYVPNPDAITYFGSLSGYRTIYMDQYTGEKIAMVDESKDFFQIVKGIHWSLLLATPIGQPIAAWCTVIFLILLISGFILWWPKKWNKIGRENSLKIKWGAKFKRLNYDLHNVLGFYTLLLSLIIGITGLYWAFPVVKKALYFMGTGQFVIPESSGTKLAAAPPLFTSETQSALEKIYDQTWKEFPEAYSITFIKGTDANIQVIVRGDSKTYYKRSFLTFDAEGALVFQDLYSHKNAGEKLMAMNYDIHVGAIGGLAGKIIALLLCIVTGSLPVTGFLIWFDRKKRKPIQTKTQKITIRSTLDRKRSKSNLYR